MIAQLFSLFFPRLCAVCGKSLIFCEKLLCLGCLSDLPRSGFWAREENPVTTLFDDWKEVAITHACAYLCYTKESAYHPLLHRLKYKGEPQIGQELGRWFGSELIQSTIYQNIDIIVPVPLHPKKERKRGYNQSFVIAEGIAEVTGWCVESGALKRIRHTATQTLLNREERQKNITGAFALAAPERIQEKHILLIDDVLTTGATLQACAAELCKASGCKIYIATIAYIE
jgi:ComF family protein